MSEDAIMQRKAITADQEMARAIFLARPSVMLGLVPVPDGDQWSVLLGDNVQVGICGFGETPDLAMAAFDRAWEGSRTPDAIRLARGGGATP